MQIRSVSKRTSTSGAMVRAAASGVPYSSSCSRATRAAFSRTSGGYRVDMVETIFLKVEAVSNS